VFAGGGAAGIKECVLGGEDERTVGDLAVRHGLLRGGNLPRGATKVEGAGAAAGVVQPGNGGVEGVIDLEDAGRGPEALEGAAITAREAVAGKLEELARGNIEEDGVGGGQIGQGADGAVALDLAPGLAKAGEQRGGDRLGAAAREGPADGMAHRSEDEANCHRTGSRQREKGVGSETGNEGTGALAAKPMPDDRLRRPKCADSKLREAKRMPGKVKDGLEDLRHDVLPAVGEGLHEPPVGPGIIF